MLAVCKKEKEQVAITISMVTPMTDSLRATVIIKGKGFGSNAAQGLVLFNGTVATITSYSDILLKVTVPVNATTGKLQIKVNSQIVTTAADFVILSGMWTKMVSLPGEGRGNLIAFFIGNKGYVGMGDTGEFGLNDLYEYDPVAIQWGRKADMPVNGSYRAVAIATSTKACIIGGSTNNSAHSKEVWKYDPVTNLWSRKADIPGIERYAAAGSCINNKIYFGTGAGSDITQPTLKDWWEYDDEDSCRS